MTARPILGYDQQRRAKATDAAWANDVGPTNRSLRDGEKVVLLTQTVGEVSRGAVMIEANEIGIVIHARTPRVRIAHGAKSQYFANVDVPTEHGIARVRVPHSALRRFGTPTRKQA